MDNLRYIFLIQKQLRGTLTAEEAVELQALQERSDDSTISEDLDRVWKHSGRYKEGYEPDVSAGLSKLKQKIAADTPKRQLRPVRGNSFSLWRIAAAIMLICSVGWLINSYWSLGASDAFVQTTEMGGKEVQLPDGTVVTLNKFSEIEYSTDMLKQPERVVYLKGEAFFDVAPNANQPFLVLTDHADVKVLGTAFNVRAVEGESAVEVGVMHGKVSLTAKAEEDSLLLVARDKGVLEKEAGRLFKVNDELEHAHFWRTHQLKIKDTKLSEVALLLERNFGTPIIFEHEEAGDCPWTSFFEDPSLDQILESLRISNDLHVKKDKKGRIILLGTACK